MNHGTARDADAPPANPGLSNPSHSSNLTVAGDVHISEERARARGGKSGSPTARGGKVQKICCHCGKDVSHEERFKDRAGYYWCMDCGVEENRTKHTIGHAAPQPVTCPDCEEPFQANQLVEKDGVRICPGCVTKREQAAEREAHRQAARKQAALEEFLAAQQRQRRILIATLVGAGLAIAAAVYAIAF